MDYIKNIEAIKLDFNSFRIQFASLGDGGKWIGFKASSKDLEEMRHEIDRALAIKPQEEVVGEDKWEHRSVKMKCKTCMWFVHKGTSGESTLQIVGRCRKHAPTMKGYPVVFEKDWCGDHKLDENKV